MNDGIPVRRDRRMRALALAALTLLAFVSRLMRMLETAEPIGTDGYYYIVQVEHLLAEGRPHVPDSSWVLRLLAGCAALAPSPILGVKLGSALLAAAAVPAAFVAGRAIARLRDATETDDGTAWALALWAAASPTLTHLSGEFPKTAGIVPALLLTLSLALSRPAGLLGAGQLGLAVLLSATAHRLGAGLVAAAASGGALGWALLPGQRGRGPTRAPILVGAIAVTLALFALATAVLPGLMNPADWERLVPQLGLRLGAPPPFGGSRPGAFSLGESCELVLAWAAAAAGMVAFVRHPSRRPALGALLAPLALALLPVWRNDVLDLGYRLALVAPVVAAPLLALAWPFPRRAWGGLARAAAVGCALASPFVAGNGIAPTRGPPYARFRAILAHLPEQPTLLIAHQGLSFLYGHLTWHEAMAWAPEPELDRTQIGRVAWGIRAGEWDAYHALLPGTPAPVPLDAEYTYVREDVWEALVAAAVAAHDDDLLERIGDWRNPARLRPAYLRRNR